MDEQKNRRVSNMNDKVISNYKISKEIYARYGVDTDKMLGKMELAPISIHCWQIDDLSGFEKTDTKMTGGISATGNAGGKPCNKEEYFAQLGDAIDIIPGAKKVAAHAVYLDNKGLNIDRNEIKPEHFENWIEFARSRRIGLDFNPTYFSHSKSESGVTLSSSDEEVRSFWVEHGKRSRKVGEFFGKELGTTCITNHWIPDGSKDILVDKIAPRMRLIKSLDEIFEESIDPNYNIDSVESKLFGLGLESYTTGSHEFYSNYCALTGKAIVCMDAGHFHPTESIATKLSSYLAFGKEIMLHVSRPVRWDSDHVVILDDETKAIMEEIVRCDALKEVHIGLDYFDGSIDRVVATAIGGRSAKKALLMAMLEPTELLKKIEAEGNLTKRLALLEEIKTFPFGFVWDMYCEMHNCPTAEWVSTLEKSR
jgi:L-rhamnose isomerase